MKKTLFALALSLLVAWPAQAADVLVYVDKEGQVRRASIVTVSTDSTKRFSARVLLGARKRTIKLDPRQIIELRRGDADDVNQWAKKLAKGRSLMRAGKLATQGTVAGAEETFTKVAYTVEEGIKGEEAAYAAIPWHNMYATLYLIEARLKMAEAGDKAKAAVGLKTVAEFRKRSKAKWRKKIEWTVPGAQGASKKGKVYGWGDTRLSHEVTLLEAKLHAAAGDLSAASAKFDELVSEITKSNLSPVLLRRAVLAKAAAESKGQDPSKAEEVFRAAGTKLASMARRQSDDFGKNTLTAASNSALLRGADLLLESAAKSSSVSYEVPLARYRQLKDNEGRNDRSVRVGAQAGIGTCLVETGKGAEAYDALLEVVVNGGGNPEATARALYYLGRASEMYAKEIDSGGGDGSFLREESERWRNDLRERFPSSEWAKKAQSK